MEYVIRTTRLDLAIYEGIVRNVATYRTQLPCFSYMVMDCINCMPPLKEEARLPEQRMERRNADSLP